MIRAILFDMGGTLDGDGLHWLDSFDELFASAGAAIPRDVLRRAFDAAEARAATDETIRTAGLDAMIERHVSWQFAHLESERTNAELGSRLRDRIVEGFAARVRTAARKNVPLLAELSARGFPLGIVSNGCGNVSMLASDLGYAPFMSVVVDSRRVGLYKPDPAIFVYAANQLAIRASSVLMVGDSYDRDIVPARSIGMRTAWLEGATARACADPSVVDVHLARLTDLLGVPMVAGVTHTGVEGGAVRSEPVQHLA